MYPLSETSQLDFDDLTPISLPVKLQGKTYSLREASEDAACRWRNAVLKAVKPDSNGKPTCLDNLSDTEPFLVSLCLFDDKDKPVPLPVVRSWSARIVKKLFAAVKEISDLDETKTAGNGQEKGTDPIKNAATPLSDTEDISSLLKS